MGTGRNYHGRECEKDRIKVIVHGLGVMGSLGVKMMIEKKGLEIVGAIALRKEKAGKDLGEVVGLNRKLGVIISNSAEVVFSDTVADIIVDTTTSFARELYPNLTKALRAGLNCVSIAEEMAYPWVSETELAIGIDKLAKKNEVTVLGTGVNPGFVNDAMPIFLSGVPGRLRRIRARRVTDLSAFVVSDTITSHYGLGLTPEEYRKKEEDGTVVAHVGGPECVALIADALGWEVEITRTKEPLVGLVRRNISGHVIEPGQVYGSKEVDSGLMNGEEVIVLEQYLGFSFDLETEGLEAGMWYWLDGEPNVEVKISGTTGPEEVATVTMARAINAIPYVLNARPGLLSVNEVGVISYLS